MLRLNPEGHRKVLEEGVEMQTIYLKGKGRTKRGSRQPLPRDLWLFYYQPLTVQCFSLWKVSSNCENTSSVSHTLHRGGNKLPCTQAFGVGRAGDRSQTLTSVCLSLCFLFLFQEQPWCLVRALVFFFF